MRLTEKQESRLDLKVQSDKQKDMKADVESKVELYRKSMSRHRDMPTYRAVALSNFITCPRTSGQNHLSNSMRCF